MSRLFVKGRAAWERFVDEEGGRDIVSRADCSILVKHEAFCDRGKRGSSGTEPCVCVPTFDVMWQGAVEGKS